MIFYLLEKTGRWTIFYKVPILTRILPLCESEILPVVCYGIASLLLVLRVGLCASWPPSIHVQKIWC